MTDNHLPMINVIETLGDVLQLTRDGMAHAKLFTVWMRVRYRPGLPWIPHGSNLRRAREYLARVKARIDAGTFLFNEAFPDFSLSAKRVPLPVSARTCGDFFDAFLRHEAARVARDDLAPPTLTAHRQMG